jgi:C_GCAxxG_C_C family probable redox protein
MKDPIQTATNRFEQGFSCSQSLFSAFAPQFGLSDEIASTIASPFGGGIARQGETCGAVTGALMALSLKFGPKMNESKDGMYIVSQEFFRCFKEKHTFLNCRQLINFDLNQPGELELARQSLVFKNVCPLLVKTAAEIVQSMLTSYKPEI